MYKDFYQPDYTLSNHIMTAKGNIPNEFLTSGSLSQTSNPPFTASIDFIQETTFHTVEFKLANALPVGNENYNSRIVVKMPSIMSYDPEKQPSVINFDGNIK